MIYLKENNLSIKKIEKELGYSEKSIFNNWKKNNKIPPKAIIAINIYIKLQNKEDELSKLFKKNENNSIGLPPKVYKIAYDKSLKNQISIEEYISSLIISNI